MLKFVVFMKKML